ncbi:hypothetical protein HK096_001547 [Nowakowskiella sp. JEL0078]|nr:hypothetical protein HK096_001547 [Nowakowskiella sp. JEL0078]
MSQIYDSLDSIPPFNKTLFLPSHSLNVKFSERYLINGIIGHGGFGLVVSATVQQSTCAGCNVPTIARSHFHKSQEVAVKFIMKSRVRKDDWVEDTPINGDMPVLSQGSRVPMEVYVLRRVHHEGVIRVWEFFEDDMFVYLVMELHGGTIDNRGLGFESSIKGNDLPLAMRPIAPIVDAVTPDMKVDNLESFSKDIFEGSLADIENQEDNVCFDKFENQNYCKVSNKSSMLPRASTFPLPSTLVRRPSVDLFGRLIICTRKVVDHNLQAKLIDFGSATIEQSPHHLFNHFVGTLEYAAPEVLRGEKYSGRASDVWCLGILLYTLLCGHSPFTSKEEVLRLKYKRPSGKDVGKNGIELIAWLLQLNPKLRPNTRHILEHRWFTSNQ